MFFNFGQLVFLKSLRLILFFFFFLFTFNLRLIVHNITFFDSWGISYALLEHEEISMEMRFGPYFPVECIKKIDQKACENNSFEFWWTKTRVKVHFNNAASAERFYDGIKIFNEFAAHFNQVIWLVWLRCAQKKRIMKNYSSLLMHCLPFQKKKKSSGFNCKII